VSPGGEENSERKKWNSSNYNAGGEYFIATKKTPIRREEKSLIITLLGRNLGIKETSGQRKKGATITVVSRATAKDVRIKENGTSGKGKDFLRIIPLVGREEGETIPKGGRVRQLKFMHSS